MNKQKNINVARIILSAFRSSAGWSALLVLLAAGAVVSALLPPLLLEKIINDLSTGESASPALALGYVGLIAVSGLMQSGREAVLTVVGQRITRRLRHELCAKLERLPAQTFVKQEPGAVVSRFVGDVDTVETLFTSGIISMISNVFQVIGIFAVIFVKNRGLALLLLALLPVVFFYTRHVQKNMLRSQIDYRTAVSKVSNHVPETVQNIRTVHLLRKEEYMRRKYDGYIDDSFMAMEKSNFCDAVYSPVIMILNVVVVAAVMLLSAAGRPAIHTFFGMSAGTAAAVINYISQVFGPIEGIGMEIQTIQSAGAGVHRINEFLAQDERWETAGSFELPDAGEDVPPIELKNVSFEYEAGHPVLKDVSFSLSAGEHMTLTGRTGAGKSTIFKLILGLYRPQEGEVLIYGRPASSVPDSSRRKLFGYVEQTFHMIPGTVAEQISLRDPGISRASVIAAAQLVGLSETIETLPSGYDTPCSEGIFSQGQWQLLSIARAVAAGPRILLLDEITANLDAETEQKVVSALQRASENRTVLSISHRPGGKDGTTEEIGGCNDR